MLHSLEKHSNTKYLGLRLLWPSLFKFHIWIFMKCVLSTQISHLNIYEMCTVSSRHKGLEGQLKHDVKVI